MRPDYRLYACVRCRRLVAVCSVCDRGQWYCGRVCAHQSRREKSRAAGRRYQASRRGRHRHAARQARYRLRRQAGEQPTVQKVTHQATPDRPPAFTLQATTRAPGPRVRCGVPEAWWSRQDGVICTVCGAVCAPYARLDFLRRRRRAGAGVTPPRSPG